MVGVKWRKELVNTVSCSEQDLDDKPQSLIEISDPLPNKPFHLCIGKRRIDAYCSLLCLQAAFLPLQHSVHALIWCICLWVTLLSAAAVLTEASGRGCWQDGGWREGLHSLSHAVKVLWVLMERINFMGSAELQPNGAWRRCHCNGHSS